MFDTSVGNFLEIIVRVTIIYIACMVLLRVSGRREMAVATWKQPAEAKAQCVDTHFSEPTKLKGLAAETKIDCGFFASEIVDEGGLPVALTDAKPS